MISVFILITGEWVDAADPVVAIHGLGSTLFFIVVVIIGKYLLMNLLVAVILCEFGGATEEGTTGSPQSTFRSTNRSDTDDTAARNASLTESDGSPPHYQLANNGSGERPWPSDHSLLCFARSNPLRRLCKWLLQQKAFDAIVILAIVISSVCLALDTPRNEPSSQLAHNLRAMDHFFTWLFFAEMSVKVVAMGFVCGEGTYLRSPWNQVDFVIVMVSLLVLLADSVPQLHHLRILRVLRVLRPLRLISRNAGMKLIITSLFKAMPAVSNVFGVVLSIQLVFAILGMQLYSGMLSTCSDPSILTRDECVGRSEHKPWGGGGGAGGGDAGGGLRVWSTPEIGSFDSFPVAMRLLYVMSSGDQWEVPMQMMMGAVEPGHAPMRDDFSSGALFALAWMFVGYVFAINLFGEDFRTRTHIPCCSLPTSVYSNLYSGSWRRR